LNNRLQNSALHLFNLCLGRAAIAGGIRRILRIGAVPLVLRGTDVLYKRDVVALEHDPTEVPAVTGLHIDLLGIVQHQIHVLVEAHDVALDAQRYVFV